MTLREVDLYINHPAGPRKPPNLREKARKWKCGIFFAEATAPFLANQTKSQAGVPLLPGFLLRTERSFEKSLRKPGGKRSLVQIGTD
jgi:hypothetical protein